MFRFNDMLIEHAVSFKMLHFYKRWDPFAPDALTDMTAAINSLLQAGIHPKRIVLHPKGGFAFIFHTWSEARDCHAVTAKVLDLLWLID